MAGCVDQLAAQAGQHLELALGELRVSLVTGLGACALSRRCSRRSRKSSGVHAGSELLAQAIDRLRRVTQRTGHVSHGAARLVGHDVADHGRVLTAIELVDVFHHLVAPFGVEVDVDVGHGVRLVAEEALEEQVMAQRIDRRDLQQIGHQRIGGRAAPLAADALLPGEAHDIPDDQEVIAQPGAPR